MAAIWAVHVCGGVCVCACVRVGGVCVVHLMHLKHMSTGQSP
jgi:hypothetical protein